MNYFYSTFFKHQWIKGLCCFFLVLGIVAVISKQVGFVYSKTNSLPHHFFLQLKRVNPLRGHYTCFHSSWYGRQVIKKVVGMEGDTLSYDHSGNLWINVLSTSSLWVGRQFKIGKPKKQSKDGRVLTPIKPGVIPKGMFFISGEHERSFDSRYEEFGLVSAKNLQGRLIALV